MKYLGDKSCANNAMSEHLRCAVNPSGPCSDCSHYEPLSIRENFRRTYKIWTYDCPGWRFNMAVILISGLIGVAIGTTGVLLIQHGQSELNAPSPTNQRF